ncbi:MAG TPA: hypothetical protein VI037_07665 [Nitrososphaera sp.]
MLSKKNNKAVLATLALMLLSLSVASSIAIITPNYASAQGLLEGLEREQSGESVLGAQPADTGAPAPINATTTVEGGCNATNANVTGTSNATNANVTGTCNPTNTTTTGDAGTPAGNQTVGGPLALYGGGGGQ